ncbi:hypothetical protein V496_00172 [Pseudogymnoascus sp. VKM F-4515 (FW-2607)]|nr:hypothetical protein V496_00172 [Pseudogymnoascus sp. VKM F-4515 (FW-2607)]KFY99572.1 hypothetical protein V498_00639 [Pseudogymnoascus sp. VKM F-4517 (FW-2822)]
MVLTWEPGLYAALWWRWVFFSVAEMKTWLQPPQNPMTTSRAPQGAPKEVSKWEAALQKINPSVPKPSASREDEHIELKRDLAGLIMRPSISASDSSERTETKHNKEIGNME